MTLSDPVANMLTAIRNANLRKHKTVVFPHSSFKWKICEKLEENNILSQCWFDEKNRNIKVDINQSVRIRKTEKISKPSKHIHWGVEEIKKYCHRRGIYFLSTSLPKTPLLTHREALAKNQGGKVIFFISWKYV